MKVAVVHGLPFGGALRRLRGEMSVLANDDELLLAEFRPSFSEPAILWTGPHMQDVPQRVHPWHASAAGLPTFFRPPFRYADHLTVHRLWSHIWREVNIWRPDVVYMNPARHPQGAPVLAELSSAPILFYCDEPRRVDYEASAAATRNPRTLRLYAPLHRRERDLDRRSVQASSALATNSSFSAGRIASAYGRVAEVITPGIAETFCLRRSTAASADYIFSAGTLVQSKGHDIAIRAIAESGTGLPLVIATPREDRQEANRLLGLAGAQGVHLSIRVGVSDRELVELYQNAFATIYLAREEPLGLVSLEAQACGCPVIVSDEGGLPGTVVDGVSGYVVGRDAHLAGERLHRLMHGGRQTMLSSLSTWRVPRLADSAAALKSALVRVAEAEVAG